MRSYIKIYLSGDFLTVSGTPTEQAPTPYALLRYHKDDAIGNLGAILQPGIAGVKEWRLYADQGSGMVDTGLVIPPQVFAYQYAYALAAWDSHPLD